MEWIECILNAWANKRRVTQSIIIKRKNSATFASGMWNNAGCSNILKTDRHINKEKLKKEEDKKQKKMEEYLKDDKTRIAKLKQIWKTLHQKTLKSVYPHNFSYHNLLKTMIRTYVC